jgi:hypothetical protein
LLIALARVPLDEGNVKGLPVVGHEQSVIQHVGRKGAQIVAVYVIPDGLAVVQGDGRDLVRGGQARRLDVEEGRDVLEVPVESPMLIGRQILGEITRVPAGMVANGFLHVTRPGLQDGTRQRDARVGQNRMPRREASRPQVALGLLANAGDMAEGVR